MRYNLITITINWVQPVHMLYMYYVCMYVCT